MARSQRNSFALDAEQENQFLAEGEQFLSVIVAHNGVTQQAQEIVAALAADNVDLTFLYGAAIETYCREKFAAEGSRRKSVRFPQGTCAFRYHAPAVRLKDHAAALQWAKENAPALVAVETVERLDADGFRDAAECIQAEDGELLPGVEYREGGDTFSLSFPTEVKPKKAKA